MRTLRRETRGVMPNRTLKKCRIRVAVILSEAKNLVLRLNETLRSAQGDRNMTSLAACQCVMRET